MPNIKSAIKRVSVTEHKTMRNKMVKSATKTALKKFNTNASVETMTAATAAVDTAAAKGVIYSNNGEATLESGRLTMPAASATFFML